jgi:hypothetical protein
VNPTAYLLLGVEQYLRELPDDEFAELVQRTRPPDGKSANNRQAAFAKSLFGGGDE